MAMRSSTVPGRYARRWMIFAMSLLAVSVFLLSLQTRLALYTPQASRSPIGSMKLASGEPVLVLVTHKGELQRGKGNVSSQAGIHWAESAAVECPDSEVWCAKLKAKYCVSIFECYSILSRPPPAPFLNLYRLSV